MLQLAQLAPEHEHQLQQIHGMTGGQIKRYGPRLLNIISKARNAPQPGRPVRTRRRPPEAVSNRYERLHNWRKERARIRGVESDVILSRQKLWGLASTNPKTMEELQTTAILAPWQYQTYGKEILHILQTTS
jgi:ribonuclease D